MKLATVARSLFLPFGSGTTVAPTYAMTVSPARLRTNRTTDLIFTGVSTQWTTLSPNLDYESTYPLTVGLPTVLGDTQFMVRVTSGALADTITWTDATYGVSVVQSLGSGGRSPGTFF